MRCSPLILVLMSLAACSPEAGAPEAVGADAGPAAAPVAEVPAAAPAAPAQVAGSLALDGEGLRVVARDSGSTRLIAFGSPEADVVDQIGTVKGGATPERGRNEECGAGPLDLVQWGDGLILWMQDGRFVGWAMNAPASGGATTMAGVGIGSTRAELEGPTVVEVSETSLGTEFSSGGLFGILSGPGQAARITNLWAGTSCNFR